VNDERSAIRDHLSLVIRHLSGDLLIAQTAVCGWFKSNLHQGATSNSEFHKRQFVVGSSPTYTNALLQIPNSTNGSLWLVQVPPTTRRYFKLRIPQTAVCGWFKSTLHQGATSNSEFHKRQFVVGSSSAYNKALLQTPNSKNGSLWLVQVHPTPRRYKQVGWI
jgi:hypothetical protein